MLGQTKDAVVFTSIAKVVQYASNKIIILIWTNRCATLTNTMFQTTWRDSLECFAHRMQTAPKMCITANSEVRAFNQFLFALASSIWKMVELMCCTQHMKLWDNAILTTSLWLFLLDMLTFERAYLHASCLVKQKPFSIWLIVSLTQCCVCTQIIHFAHTHTRIYSQIDVISSSLSSSSLLLLFYMCRR